MIKKCKHCNVEFPEINGRSFSNHVRWCEKNPLRNKTENISLSMSELYDRQWGKKTEFVVACHKCSKKFAVIEREKQHPLKEHYYCSRSCANSHKKSDDEKQRIANALRGRLKGKGNLRVARQNRICLNCNKSFECLPSQNRKFCNMECRRSFTRSSDEFLAYRHACSFKFNVWQYPDEFDTDLIRRHGWYSASNRGGNLGGVSRDHRISVRYGWENNIPPSILSHPSNCKLMLHTENISKLSKCSITLDELKNEIERWNKKYNQ